MFSRCFQILQYLQTTFPYSLDEKVLVSSTEVSSLQQRSQSLQCRPWEISNVWCELAVSLNEDQKGVL